MFGFPSISASVRLSFKIRSYARADNPNLVIAFSSNPFDSESIAQYFRINRGDICALQKILSLAKRSNCTRRARTTLSRMSDELSPGASLASSLNFTAGTSMCMSIRSSNGPEIFDTYRWIWIGEHLQSRVGSLKNPQGQGFIAAASMKRDGNVNDIDARLIVTLPSSNGCRRTSSTFRSNSGNSSRNSMPL